MSQAVQAAAQAYRTSSMGNKPAMAAAAVKAAGPSVSSSEALILDLMIIDRTQYSSRSQDFLRKQMCIKGEAEVQRAYCAPKMMLP